MIICTSICANYLPKAAVLAKSVKKHNPDVRFIICLVERTVEDSLTQYTDAVDEIILAKDLGFTNFENFIFQYDIIEASTAVKGQLFKYLMKTYSDHDQFIYLDPDIKVYGEFHELQTVLKKSPIVLTPHLTIPEDDDDIVAITDNEIDSALSYGIYNLGFLAVRRSDEAGKFIDWWTNRLSLYCYDNMTNRGLYTDQKWIDLAPCYFDVCIFKNSGYNVASWNMSKRKIEKVGVNRFKVNGDDLVFYHFSGFDNGRNENMIHKYVPDQSNAVYEIRDQYVSDLKDCGQEKLSLLEWSYGYFDNGEKIDKNSRVRFRTHEALKGSYENPFSANNKSFDYLLPPSSQFRLIYIWGAGDGGIKTKKYYERCNTIIEGFVDSDSKKWGQTIEGVTIYNPQTALTDQGNQRPYFIIGSSYKSEIIEILKNNGFELHTDFTVSQPLQSY